MRIFRLAARGAVMCLLVASCTGDHASATTGTSTTGAGSASSAGSGGAGGSAAGAIIDMFCSSVEPLFCETYFTCCTHPHLVDMDACLKAHPLWYCAPDTEGDRPFLEASLQSGATIFDPAQFDTCLKMLKSLSAGGAACVEPPWAVLDTVCHSAFQGQIAPGEACSWPPGGYWKDRGLPCRDGSCDNGTCVPFLKVGDACPIDQFGQSNNQLCNPFKQVWCVGDQNAGGSGGGAGLGICSPQGDIGDACHPSNYHECKSQNCDQTASKCALPDPYWSACDPFP